MKLVHFRQQADAAWRLGLLRQGAVEPVDALPDLQAWLELPADQRAGLRGSGHRLDLGAVQLGPAHPRPPLMVDMGLTPAHLLASARTLLRHELPPGLGWLAGLVIGRAAARVAPPYRYYKANPAAVIGPDQLTGWPRWSSYVDVEPELAVVIGAGSDGRGEIAGYTIWNDLSARDVQLPEMVGAGPARSKDFDGSNALGPCLVSPDALPRPRSLAVEVDVGGRLHWQGSTADYAASPQQAIDDLQQAFTLPPGAVVGLGTVPGCTGLDHDRWARPGEQVRVTFQGIGTLVNRLGQRPVDPLPSRWGPRSDLPS